MIKRINSEEKTMITGKPNNETIIGKVQQVNERGLKVNDRWYNFSRFLTQKPNIAVNDTVKLIVSNGFIMDFTIEEKEENRETMLLEALRSAVKIASILENEVPIKFSTQDIIKLALTLFIQGNPK